MRNRRDGREQIAVKDIGADEIGDGVFAIAGNEVELQAEKSQAAAAWIVRRCRVEGGDVARYRVADADYGPSCHSRYILRRRCATARRTRSHQAADRDRRRS